MKPKKGRLGVLDINCKCRINAIIETILFLNTTEVSDKQFRELVTNICIKNKLEDKK